MAFLLPCVIVGMLNLIWSLWLYNIEVKGMNNCPFRYEPVLVQEMLTLIMQIVQERRFSGLTPAENLKRELVQKLAIGDATHSQLVKSLPRDLSKYDQLQEILDSVAVYSNPSGFNQVCFVPYNMFYLGFCVDISVSCPCISLHL